MQKNEELSVFEEENKLFEFASFDTRTLSLGIRSTVIATIT